MILQIVGIVVIILFLLVMLIPFQLSATGKITPASRNFEIVMSWLGIPIWRIKMHGSILSSLLSRSSSRFGGLPRSLWRALKLRKLKGELTFGTGDPADTAMLAGYLWSVSSILGGLFRPFDFSVNPDLNNASLQGSLRAEVRVRLGSVFAILLRTYVGMTFKWALNKVSGTE